MRSFLEPLLRSPELPQCLENSRNARVLAREVMSAFDSESRRRGLLGRASLPEGSALIIAPCSAVHTFFMRFAIDVAFVTKDGRVLKIRQAVPPWRMTAALRAFAVIELPAGALHHADTIVGDTLRLSTRQLGL